MPPQGRQAEIVSGDHRNKPDIGSNIATVDRRGQGRPDRRHAEFRRRTRRQRDRARQNKVFINSGRVVRPTGREVLAQYRCTGPMTLELANGHRQGDREDRATPGSSSRPTTRSARAGARHPAVVEANGGKVVGKVRHPSTAAFSSFCCRRRRPRQGHRFLPRGATPSTRSVGGGVRISRAAKPRRLWCSPATFNALGLATAKG